MTEIRSQKDIDPQVKFQFFLLLLTGSMGLADVGIATGLGWCLAVAFLSYSFYREKTA